MAELCDLISKSSLETSRITASVQAAVEGESNQLSIAALIEAERELQMMRKQERAHFFSTKEQELILKLYEEERDILTAKSNTSSASRLREEAWQRIADKINAASDSGYKRSWQQVKIKHKNIIQSARRRRAEMLKNGFIPPLSPTDIMPQKDRLRVEVLPSAECIEPLSDTEASSAYINVSGHPVILMPVTKTEPESMSSDETDISDTHYEGIDVHNSSMQEVISVGNKNASSSRSVEVQKDDLRSLYCTYLKKEIENREQLMAYRALKMKKLEKEILLLDKQLA
ncbi:uncharacterized protein LOC110163307 isoform X2 [Boleophthalmus pectinirostris]|uniref:uncharacterized protein LOC110163307 isoform X2 n=1 Tax=Boleophthalmus pectinirostris TaxID=150288 RepID=UPI000A1C5373|nr:uncharacterized protein LOC110163307 isoform X2 [Boleophthalmus pectinirostris]